MSKSAYEVGYDDGYNGRERLTEGALTNLFMQVELPGTSSPVDNLDYEEYNHGYDDGMTDAAKDWTA